MSYLDEGYDSEYESEVMQGSVDVLAKEVVGRKIVSVETGDQPEGSWYTGKVTVLTLDDGSRVRVSDTDDCCAFTEVESFKFLENVDHVITRVETDEGFNKWHIYADTVPVLEMDVTWSPGNPYYYGFGFSINVEKENN